MGSFSGLTYYAVVQGAGGMHMVDPLFQWVLVIECKNRKIPVIFDEVFTGFWRLGVEVIILEQLSKFLSDLCLCNLLMSCHCTSCRLQQSCLVVCQI